jgi:hypothetical protein
MRLDIRRDTHSEELRNECKESESTRVPWKVILDAAGKPLITSNAKEPEEESFTNDIGVLPRRQGSTVS